ncbi:MAG: ABC transporter permease, partial [Candidatus Dormiibacterota bacterium]
PRATVTAAPPTLGRASSRRTPRAASRATAVREGVGDRSTYQWFWNTGLLNVLTIARRELGAYFVSPIGYVVGAALVIPVSFLGYLAYLAPTPQPVSMTQVFQVTSFLMVFLVPLYTMRQLAEERRLGTLEMLLTSPVRDWEVVVGKWLGCFVFFLASVAFTLVYVVLMSVYTEQQTTFSLFGLSLQIPAIDYGSIISGYVGLVLVGATWVALGLFASSLTSNQIIAAVVAVGILLAFEYFFSVLSGYLGNTSAVAGGIFGYLDASSHAGDFAEGRVFLRDVVYFVSVVVAALFCTVRVLDARRWRAA